MTALHTPGPWVIKRNRSVTARRPDGLPGVMREIVVAEVLSGGTASIAEADANARLIAAAPEMLLALRRAAMALAFAAEESPAMEDDYNAVSRAIAAAAGVNA